MQNFIRPADRWILVVSAIGVVVLGRGWHFESLWLQIIGYLVLFFTTSLIKDKYTGWRAIFHLDLYLLLSGLIFVFS